jgi:hypothetical protein
MVPLLALIFIGLVIAIGFLVAILCIIERKKKRTKAAATTAVDTI